jgi:phosphate transport system substrate-binding protein
VKKTFVLIVGILFVLVMTPMGFGQNPEKVIRVNGAGMASDQVQGWANEFMKSNPGVNVIVTGSSAGKGFKALIEQTTDFALASRDIRPEEEKQAEQKGLKLDKKVIGHSGVAVVTNEKNPVNELTLDQLRKIFLGEYTNWSQVGGPDVPIRCFTRRVPESGGAVFFQNQILQGRPYGATTKMTETWGTITKACSVATDFPIGIAPWTRAAGPGLKILGIKKDDASPATKPTAESMKDAGYPIILPFSFYWSGPSLDPELRKFVDFCAAKGAPKEGAM